MAYPPHKADWRVCLGCFCGNTYCDCSPNTFCSGYHNLCCFGLDYLVLGCDDSKPRTCALCGLVCCPKCRCCKRAGVVHEGKDLSTKADFLICNACCLGPIMN